jgi:sterol desaturase/sphingolipid hydroxylase (fatty acid hydroxylase superfamily)
LEEGGNTNFAGTFPIWDVLFGTFRMPDGKLPEAYGKDEAAMPSGIIGQLAFPFRRARA